MDMCCVFVWEHPMASRCVSGENLYVACGFSASKNENDRDSHH